MLARRLIRTVLLESYRQKRHDKILSLFVLLIESGTLYVIVLVRLFLYGMLSALPTASIVQVTDLAITSSVTSGNETIGRMIDCISAHSTVQFVVSTQVFEDS